MEHTELVGRDGELAALTSLLDEAADGRSVVALVGGDAGVGKTRLTAEVRSIAAGRGFTVLTGQCAQIGDSVPYLALADALRSPAVRDTEAVQPVLAWLLPDTPAEQRERDWAGLSGQQMLGAVLGLLAELAAQRPVLLVLEDLHWADASTRALLAFLSRMLHRERVLIACTYRTDDLHRSHPLRPLLAELRRLPTVTAIDLGPLAAAAMAAHLSALIPHGRGSLDAATLNSLVERAEGNAYYAEELLAADESKPERPVGPAVIADRAELPSGLAALLLSRVERLSADAQVVLRAASVAGRRASDDLVRAASGLSDAQFDAAVREAVAHQLLVPSGDGYTFRHALLREAVYNDLLPGERTRLHATFATLLTERDGSPAELAKHCLASHDIRGAFAASIRAAAESEHMAAPAEAHQHFEEALGLWDRVPDAEALAKMTKAKLAMYSAMAAASSGNVPRAVSQLRRLWKLLPADTELKIRSRVGERLAYFLLQLDQPGAVADAVRVARQTVEVSKDGPATWHRARALATLANALLFNDEHEHAMETAEQARSVAREANSPWLEADALITLGALMNRAGRSDEAVRLLTTAHEEAREAKVLGVELRAAYSLAASHLSAGDLRAAATIAHEGVRRAEETGLVLAPYGMDVQHLHFQAHYASGEWDHAAEIASGFPVRVTSLPEAILSSMALFIDVARGEPLVEERRHWLQPFWDDVFCAYISRGMLAEHELWRGNLAAGAAEAAAALDVEFMPKYGRSPASIRVAAVALWALADQVRAGEAPLDEATRSRAAELLEVAREGAAFAYRPKTTLGPEGRGWLARAEAEYARVVGKNDPSLWRTVLTEFGPCYRYECARTRLRLVEALLEPGDASGQRAEAAAEFAEAYRVATELGARPLTTALEDLARRGRLPLTQDAQPQDAPPDGLATLTEREREVLGLLAEGRSNREIAATLFIAPKTASVHVSNILGKLGAASRNEAAAIARRGRTPG
jgi:DNA-binding CsgD family transcriptional regulator/tetratricopeptide (TPR) repeat protein